jgi:hypothetical protein
MRATTLRPGSRSNCEGIVVGLNSHLSWVFRIVAGIVSQGAFTWVERCDGGPPALEQLSRNQVWRLYPGVEISFEGIELEPDGPLTLAEEAKVAMLTQDELDAIDACRLSHTPLHARKVARVVAEGMRAMGDRFPDLPDTFYVRRIKHLFETGHIEAAGDLDRMRYSEICLAH